MKTSNLNRVKNSAPDRPRLCRLEISYEPLSSLLSGKDDLRARDYVDKIDESELRKSARAYIDASLAIRAVEKKDPERALQVAKNGELSHFVRAWLLSQVASLLAKTDREQALSLLEDSAAEAGRIETSDPERPRAFFAIANVVLNLNRPAVWDTMSDAIKAANSADKFTGEDGQITFGLNTKGSSSINQHLFLISTLPESSQSWPMKTTTKRCNSRAASSAKLRAQMP